MKELKLGTEIKFPFITLKVVEADGYNCSNCYFADVCRSIGGLVRKTFGTCVASEREDNTNVIFKEALMDKKEEKKSLENELSLREKIELRKEAYRLALHIQPIDSFKSKAEWLDFKSREIYDWLLTGKN